MSNSRRCRALRWVRARSTEAVEILLEPADTFEDAPAIDFELRLTRTAVADEPAARATARALLAELLSTTAQTRQAIPELGELHLHHALLAVRMLGEDVEDQRDAIDDVAREQLLEVALLRGRELVVEHHEVDVERFRELAQLFRLARTDVGGGIGSVAPLEHELDRLCACGVDEERELVE